MPAIALVVLPLLARRRFPFAAPAAVWLLAAALSFVDGRLVVFTDQRLRRRHGRGVPARQPARRASRRGVGPGRRARRRGDRRRTTTPIHAPGELVFIPLLFAIGWLAGFALRERAEQAEAAEERATQAEREREAAARIAVAEERARIARELHDIVAHAVSVMVLQVGAVRHRLPDALGRGPRRARGRRADRPHARSPRCAACSARCAATATTLELAPQPGLDGLDALLDEVRPRRACPCGCSVEGEPVPLPRAIDLSAYRIVQEGLTNALKHARASQADVDVRYAPDELQIEVRDDGRGAATSDGLGHGLVGIRERVKIYGGEMTAGAANGGGFVLSARLPLGGDAAMTIRVARRRRPVDGPRRLPHAARRARPTSRSSPRPSNGLEAVDKAARFQPDVVLMDIRMPELDGLEATRRILAADAAARVLILTTFDLDEYVYEALRAGASGFVLKDDPPEQLIAAIRTVAAGDALLSPAVTTRVIEQFTRSRARRRRRRSTSSPRASSTSSA